MPSVLSQKVLEAIHSTRLNKAIKQMLVAFIQLMESENGKFLFLNTKNKGTIVFRWGEALLARKGTCEKISNSKVRSFFLLANIFLMILMRLAHWRNPTSRAPRVHGSNIGPFFVTKECMLR